MADEKKKVADEQDSSVDVSTDSKPASDDELDKSKTVAEAMGDKKPDDDTKEMLDATSDIDDDVLAETSKNLADDNKVPEAKKERNFKKLFKIMFVFILLAGVAAAVWFFIFKDKDTQTTTQPEASQQAVENVGNTPDAIVYAYRDTVTEPNILYWRPAQGGDRTKIASLAKDQNITQYDARKNVVVYSTEKAITVSTDGGRSFKDIVLLDPGTVAEPGDQITSLVVSNEADKIAYGYLADGTEENVVTAVDLDGQNKTELFKSDKRGVFITAYSSKMNKIVYDEGCYNCDGATIDPQIRDLKSDKVQQIDKSLPDSISTYESIAVSTDFSQLVVAQGTVDNDVEEGFGTAIITPYTVSKISLAGLKKAEVATVGKPGEKNPNGTEKNRNVLVGFVGDSNDVYYSDDSDIYATVDGSAPAVIFSAQKLVIYAPFVSDEFVISGSGDDTNNYQLTNYNLENKKSSKIFVGDDNTTILGVTTK